MTKTTIYFKFVFLFFFYLCSFKINAQTLNLTTNDVSLLFPLPPLEEWNDLPQGTSAGQNGELLPLAIVNQLPQLVAIAPNDKVYSVLRVVGLRIDPCFHEGPSPIKCQPQIRMIWQPLAEGDEITSTFDASLHSFYNLTTEQFTEFIKTYSILVQNNGAQNTMAPLGVNPILKSQGLQGPFFTELKKLVYQYAGANNLSRVTFMQLFMNGNIWEFGGFDIDHQELTPINIARTQHTTQKFKNSASPQPVWFHGSIEPQLTASEDDLSYLVLDSREVSLENEEQIKQATKAAFHIENPNLHNPGTIDCVSCHVAQSAKFWSMQQFPTLNLEQIFKNDIFQSPLNLQNTSPLQNQTNVLRAFGYFMESPITAQRTINESASVAVAVNAYLANFKNNNLK